MVKRQEMELKMAELKMLRFLLGAMRMDMITKEYIRGKRQFGQFRDKMREVKLS